MGWRKDLNSKPGEQTSGLLKKRQQLGGMASAGRGMAGREIAGDGVEIDALGGTEGPEPPVG